jgi:hypothetical protein
MQRMNFWRCCLLGLLLAQLALAGCAMPRTTVPRVLAAPHAFSGPVNGGCYLATLTTCRIHIDRWQPIVTDQGQKLVGFQLSAVPVGSNSSSLLYDFRSDVSNPPAGSYLPSLVKKDFAAQCSVTYELALYAKDSADLDFEAVGRTNEFQCPAAATPTPPPTATSGPTPIATVSPHASPTATTLPGWQNYLPVIRD